MGYGGDSGGLLRVINKPSIRGSMRGKRVVGRRGEGEKVGDGSGNIIRKV